MICTFCQRVSPVPKALPSICLRCEHEIASLQRDRTVEVSGRPVRMLYQYEGLIRSLVIRAKVTNDAVAAGFVVRYIMTAWQRDQKDEDLRLVIPAPPSFWGRIRGRIDLAELVAWSFGSLGHPVLSVIPGGPLRSKRAGRNTLIDRKFLKTDFFNKNIFYFNEKRRSQALISRYKQILVVDDVLTTGLTMGSVFNQLEELGAQSVAGLVFASSS